MLGEKELQLTYLSTDLLPKIRFFFACSIILDSAFATVTALHEHLSDLGAQLLCVFFCEEVK